MVKYDPRLYLAKKLLTHDGVMFISIDDNEVTNLIKICNDIFYESNVDVMIWRKSGIGRDGKMKNTPTFRKDHEYVIVCYNRELKLNKSFEKPQWANKYGNPDKDPRGGYKAGSISKKESASNPEHKNYYTVTSPSGKTFTRQFDVSFEEFKILDEDNRIYWGKNNDSVPSIKIFEDEEREVTTSSLLSISEELNSDVIDDKKCTTTKGSKELDELLQIEGIGGEMRPKPVELIKKLIRVGSGDEDIILDFFSGTSTTFQAIMEFNEKYGTSKKSIMVQIPEEINSKENKVTYKAGYKNICQIAYDRIKNSSKNISSEVDIGFKVFRVDDSNFIPWNPNVDSDNIEHAILSTQDNLVTGRSELDLIYELLLKLNLDLNASIEEVTLDNSLKNKVYVIRNGFMLVCLDEELSDSIADDLLNLKKELKSTYTQVILKDSALNDSDSINIYELLKSNNVRFYTI